MAKPTSPGAPRAPIPIFALILIAIVAFTLWRLFSSTQSHRSVEGLSMKVQTETPNRPPIAPGSAATPWPVHPAATADPNETPLPTVWPKSTPEPNVPREAENSGDDAREAGEASKDNDAN